MNPNSHTGIRMPHAGRSQTRPFSIDSLLDHGRGANPQGPALVCAHRQFTWSELARFSTRLATHYLALGLQPGDRIASLMPNCPELIIHYLACLKAGLVATPLNYRYVTAEIDHALDVSGTSLLLSHAERDGCLAKSRIGRLLPQGVIRFQSDDATGLHWEQLLRHSPVPVRLPTLAPEAPAFLYFTSGSTGKPKGVTHSRQTYGAMIRAAIGGMELTDGDVFLPGSSLSHIGGSLFGLSTLAAGGALVIASGSGGSEVLSLMRQYRPSVMFMLPTALLALVHDHQARPDDFSSIRLCLSGGDKVARQLEEDFTRIAGFPIDESYGMTEIGLATLNPPSGVNHPGSVGRLCPGYEMSLRDDANGEVSIGTPGRLWIRSPTNMTGYWDNPQATAEVIVDGWLDTGDVMRVDDDGYVWFCGRKKQIIIHDGSNICPQEVEEAVMQHPAIEAAGVIGIHDLVHGENVRVYVTLKEHAEKPTAEAIIRFAQDRVGYKAPEEVVFLDAMPTNTAGKLDRAALMQLAHDQLATRIPLAQSP